MGTEATDSRLHIYKRRRSAKERKAFAQSKAIVTAVRAGTDPKKPKTTDISAQTKALRATLSSMRGEVKHKNRGNAETVAQGLAALSSAVAKMEQAQRTKDPEDRLRLLGDAAADLAGVISFAGAAGRDWPL
jgi:hypothetical protein